MTDREKLIKLLQNFADGTYYKNGTIIDGTKVDEIADYLIANDVIFGIHCENCVFGKYIEDSGNYKCTTTKGRFSIVKPYDSCSYGERKKSK